MWLGDHLYTSVIFPCVQEFVKFRQNSLWQVDLPSTFVIFLCGRETFHSLPSLFREAGRPSVNFRHVFLWPGDLPSTSVKFWCNLESFLELSSSFRAARRLTVNFHQIPCGRETFYLLLSTFCVARKPSVNLRQLSLWSGTFCPLFVQHGDFPPTFLATGRLSSTSDCFLCSWEKFYLLSVWPRVLPSTSINFWCDPESFLELLSTFRAAR